MTNRIFKQYTGTLDAFKTWLAGEGHAESIGDSVVFIHETPKYSADAENATYSGYIYANGFFYTAKDVEGFELTAEKIKALIDDAESNVEVEVKDGKLVFTAAESATTADVTAAATVGYLEKDTVIPEGTSLQDLVDMIFNPELDVTAVKPTLTLKDTPDKQGTYEVGDSVTLNLSTTYADGYFEAIDDWGDDQAAGCEANDDVTYYIGSTQIESNYTINFATPGSASVKATETYNASSNTPKTSKGNDSSVSITAGIATSNTLTYKAYYRYFIGSSTTKPADLTASEIRDLSTAKGFISSSSVSVGNKTFDAMSYALIAVPDGVAVEAWDSMNLGKIAFDTVSVANVGLDGKSYTVYYIFNATTDSIQYNSIKIG